MPTTSLSSTITKPASNSCTRRHLITFTLALAASLLLAAPTHAQRGSSRSGNADYTEPTNPSGGWRYLDSDTPSFRQDVRYPASRVNTGGKSGMALISGKIRASPKTPGAQSKPPTAVINGVALPLETDQAGNYARPYMFGVGSNSVAIKNADGSVAQRTQFYEANPGRSTAKIRIVMSWNSDNTDVDLHVLTPKGEHAWYGNRILKDGSGIDVDVTTGYGPEIYSSTAPQRGEYQIYANYYGGRDPKKPLTEVCVAIITNEGTPNEKQQVFTAPLRKPGELILVKSFIY